MDWVESDRLRWMADGTPDAPIAYANHEPFVLPILRESLPDGGVFVDVGAHTGRYSLRLADKARMVYAFEPHPFNRQRLNEHLRMNEIKNVVVSPFACDVAWRVAALNDCEARSSFTNTLGTDYITVLTAPLDDMATSVSLLKIDVEGHEFRVLQGAKKLITRHQPTIFIEIHPWVDPILTSSELDALSYTHVNVGASGEQEYWLCQPIT